MNRSSNSSTFSGLQPVPAWIAILGLWFLTVLLILVGGAKILNILFPAGALVVGIFLYVRYPVLYIGFTWWIIFLTPFIRRLIDYHSSFTNPSLILLSPYLVTMVTIITFCKHSPKAYVYGGLPFILSFLGVIYGYLIGLIQTSPFVSTVALLEWLSPILFAFHLFVNWQDYPSYSQNIQRTFVWGALVMGTYGVIQYLIAPEWDRFWLRNLLPIMISAGSPEPMGMRVWSTLNSPGVFAAVMMAALLLLFNYKGVLLLPTVITGYLSFLLSSVRTAWIAWLLGLLFLLGSVKLHIQRRIILSILVIALCLVPLTTMEPFSTVVTSRLETFANLQEDGSAQERQRLYERELNNVLTNYVGEGIAKKRDLDSGILDLILSLGWLGAGFYLSGIVMISSAIFSGLGSFSDPFFGIARAIAFATFLQMLSGRSTIGSPGLIFWSFLAMSLSACKYYKRKVL